LDAGAPYKLQEILVRWDEEISTRDKINNRFLGVLMDATIDKIEIRAATEADIPQLRELIELSVRRLQAGDYAPEQIEGALGHALGLDTQLVADRTYFIAEIRDVGGAVQMVACGGWSHRKTLFGSDGGPNRESALLDPKNDAAKIRAIFVHPDFARRGIGSLILKHCEDVAAAAGFSRLEMGSTLTGVPLYRLKGYVEQERIDIPLPNGEVLPVVKMTKTLR
jgi:GNAT superfamily N-acetyltransferase